MSRLTAERHLAEIIEELLAESADAWARGAPNLGDRFFAAAVELASTPGFHLGEATP